MLEQIDFDKAPIFYKCPSCKKVGFILIAEVGGHGSTALGGTWYSGYKLYRCNNCHTVISE